MTALSSADVSKIEFDTLKLRNVGPISVLMLNRPAARNAIDARMREELRIVVDHIAADTACRGVVLTGTGTAFCGGGDIRGMQERIDQGARVGEIGWRRQRELHGTLEKLYNLDKPTLAAINGGAIGLGLDLALTCDFVWSSDAAVMASSFIARGLVPDGGGMFHLPRRVGLSKAKELVFSGRRVNAAEAERIGLVDRVVAPGELLSEAVEFLTSLADHPATAQAMAKSVLNGSFESSLVQVNALASSAQAFCYASPDHLESVREFLAGREKAVTP